METNIVEVENFVQHTDERRGSAFTQEVKRYLEKYPDTQFIDVLLTDLNGCFRGKRIPVAGLSKLEKGCYFPASVFAMDILGNVVEEAGLGQELGEPDCICVPVPGTLTPSAADPEYIGQVQLTMVDGYGDRRRGYAGQRCDYCVPMTPASARTSPAGNGGRS